MNTDTSRSNPPDAGTERLGMPMLEEVLPPSAMSLAAIQSVHREVRLNDALPGLVLHEPTAILLDINNLFRRARDQRFRIDYLKLKTLFEQRCDLRYAAGFSAVDQSDEQAVDWVKFMRKIGYNMDVKNLHQYVAGDGTEVVKGNMDIEMTCAAKDLPDAFTHVIIGTSDRDFIALIKNLKKNPARRVSVLGMSGPNWAGMSRQLVEAADNFYDLSRIQEYVEFRGPTRERSY
jgi:uncharacterized LabA/DUF88 family protein